MIGDATSVAMVIGLPSSRPLRTSARAGTGCSRTAPVRGTHADTKSAPMRIWPVSPGHHQGHGRIGKSAMPRITILVVAGVDRVNVDALRQSAVAKVTFARNAANLDRMIPR